MNAEQLSRVGEKLVKRCGSRDPFEIARQLGINVMLCENFGSLKGMYRVIKRNRFIFLNNSLDENMLRIVCAHELGHDQLHRNMAKTTPIHEFMLYDMKSCLLYTSHNRTEPSRSLCRLQADSFRVIASGFFISDPSLAKILLKLTPAEIVSPNSNLTVLRI